MWNKGRECTRGVKGGRESTCGIKGGREEVGAKGTELKKMEL